MISIKDYASLKGVSYEAIRQQVDRYKDELDGHIIKQGKTRFLDDEAVAFLDEKRASNPVVVYEQNKDEEIARLRQENELLLKKLVTAQERLLDDADRIAALTAEVAELRLLQAAKEPSEPPKTEEDPPQKKSFWARIFDGLK